MKSRHRPVVSGVEEMVHAEGAALEDFATRGSVWVHGERWNARTKKPISKGQAFRVTRVDGLTLLIEAIDENSS